MNQHSAVRLKAPYMRSAARSCVKHACSRGGGTNTIHTIEMAQSLWEQMASTGDWKQAEEVSQLATILCPDKSFGWENWAWSLHMQGKVQEAYDLLAPKLKKLTVPGPPSGRAAYCLACFCAMLGKSEEAARWLRLSLIQARDKNAFRLHALREPALRPLWATIDMECY